MSPESSSTPRPPSVGISIIPDSGTGELKGLTGDGSLDAKGGPNGTYELDYALDG